MPSRLTEDGFDGRHLGSRESDHVHTQESSRLDGMLGSLLDRFDQCLPERVVREGRTGDVVPRRPSGERVVVLLTFEHQGCREFKEREAQDELRSGEGIGAASPGNDRDAELVLLKNLELFHG